VTACGSVLPGHPSDAETGEERQVPEEPLGEPSSWWVWLTAACIVSRIPLHLHPSVGGFQRAGE